MLIAAEKLERQIIGNRKSYTANPFTCRLPESSDIGQTNRLESPDASVTIVVFAYSLEVGDLVRIGSQVYDALSVTPILPFRTRDSVVLTPKEGDYSSYTFDDRELRWPGVGLLTWPTDQAINWPGVE